MVKEPTSISRMVSMILISTDWYMQNWGERPAGGRYSMADAIIMMEHGIMNRVTMQQMQAVCGLI